MRRSRRCRRNWRGSDERHGARALRGQAPSRAGRSLDSQTLDSVEVLVIGDDERSVCDGRRRDPDVVLRNRAPSALQRQPNPPILANHVLIDRCEVAPAPESLDPSEVLVDLVRVQSSVRQLTENYGGQHHLVRRIQGIDHTAIAAEESNDGVRIREEPTSHADRSARTLGRPASSLRRPRERGLPKGRGVDPVRCEWGRVARCVPSPEPVRRARADPGSRERR